MLGVEPDLIAQFVNTGQVQLVFWPVLNHGNPSVFATLTAECVGRQDPRLFWDAHQRLFAQQSDLWRADRDYYVQTAVALGADQAAFEACYDGGEALEAVMALDAARLERGVYSQPQFNVNGEQLIGYQSLEIFADAVDFFTNSGS